MGKLLTTKDRFINKMKRIARQYTLKITSEDIFCNGSHSIILKAYEDGAKYGWDKRDKARLK